MTHPGNRYSALNRTCWTLLLLASVALGSLSAVAATSLIYTPPDSDKALSGYDPVAYFTAGKPVKGKKKYALEYKGATWLFSNSDNRDRFANNPDKYAPQYGGYCAFSIAQGTVVRGDPALWVIEDDKLYINLNEGIHKLWLARIDTLIDRADKNWPGILGNM